MSEVISSLDEAKELVTKLELYLAINHVKSKGVLVRSIGASLGDDPAINVRKCLKAYVKYLFPTCEVKVMSRGVVVNLTARHSEMIRILRDSRRESDWVALTHVPEVGPALDALAAAMSSLGSVVRLEVPSYGDCILEAKASLDTLRGRSASMYELMVMIVASIEQFKAKMDNLALVLTDIPAQVARGNAIKAEAARLRELELSKEVDDVLTRLTGLTYGQGLMASTDSPATVEAQLEGAPHLVEAMDAGDHDDRDDRDDRDDQDDDDQDDDDQDDAEAEDIVDAADAEDMDTVEVVDATDGQRIRIARPRPAQARMANEDEMARLRNIMRQQGLI